jgi:hypothetical protein
MKKKKAFFNTLTTERETTIMNKYLNVNKENLLKILDDIEKYHKELVVILFKYSTNNYINQSYSRLFLYLFSIFYF